jgi:hypothetical protein
MRTLMAGRARTAKKTCVPRILTCLGTAAFAVAAAWLWLATKGVTEALAPQAGPDVAPQQAMRIFYRWLVATLPQERYYTSIAIAGFLCLAATALPHRNLLGHDRARQDQRARDRCQFPAVDHRERAGTRRPPRRRSDGHPRQPDPGHQRDRIHHRHDQRRFALAMIGTGMLAFATGAAVQHPGAAHGSGARSSSRSRYWPPPDPAPRATTTSRT